MMRLEHRFVNTIPYKLEEGVLYISIEYNTVSHLCACGCGKEVALMLSPEYWKLIYNGDTISLYPSIENRFACESHYWIRDSKIQWCYGQKRKRKRWWRFFMSFIGL